MQGLTPTRFQVTELGKASSAYASVAGRSEGNLTDVLVAFGDVGLELSGDKGVMGYGLKAVEEPFNQPVPAYPVRKKQRLQLTLRLSNSIRFRLLQGNARLAITIILALRTWRNVSDQR